MDIFNHLHKRNDPIKEPILGQVTLELAEVADQILGWSGRLIDESKSNYKKANPDHKVYFNACIFNKEGTQIWFGDIDFNLDESKLKALAERVGGIYVTPESFRWEGLPAEWLPSDKEMIVHYE